MPAAAPARARRSSHTARKAVPVRIPPADRRQPSNHRPRSRAHLQVVTDARVAAARRRRRARSVLILLGAFVTVSLFALAAFHAVLASGQAELDRIVAQVGDAQARYEGLRVDVARLESPAHVVHEAQARLGMVPPGDITYLTPSEAIAAEVGQAAASGPSPTTTEAGDRAAWASIKPYLTGRP